MASRTALAISALRSMNDWLSIALTFTVTCGAGAVCEDPLDGLLAGVVLACCEPAVGAVNAPLIDTGDGGT